MTLIEVVAGLALMATLLVTMLVLKSRFTQHLASSDRRLRGVAAADSLLDDWWANPAAFPINRTGAVPQYPGLNWQTRLIANPDVSRLRARVVHLDILDGSATVASAELLLPMEKHVAK